jgi:hypothetical protein
LGLPLESPRQHPERVVAPHLMDLPPDVSNGNAHDWQTLATLRTVSMAAVTTSVGLGTIRFGTVCGFHSWILTDNSGLIAEARRMDGQLYPPVATLRERKAHTIRGSMKSWPVGLTLSGFRPQNFHAVLAVEGGPDYLAAHHFAFAGRDPGKNYLPIAFLGAGSARALHPKALEMLRGVRVRFYPHADKAGTRGASEWAAQLKQAGASVDAFNFAELRRSDGSPVKDLNDCCSIHAGDARELEALLP